MNGFTRKYDESQSGGSYSIHSVLIMDCVRQVSQPEIYRRYRGSEQGAGKHHQHQHQQQVCPAGGEDSPAQFPVSHPEPISQHSERGECGAHLLQLQPGAGAEQSSKQILHCGVQQLGSSGEDQGSGKE